MRGWRRSVLALAGVGVLLVGAGCAPKVASTGQKLADPGQPLDTALAKLKSDNNTGIQNNSITVSSATECFYAKGGKDAKGVTNQAYCGPIRRLGLSDAQVWDRYQLTFTSNSDGDAVAAVGTHTAQGIAVDTSLLVSPTGDKPSAASQVPAPQAPQTSVANRAVAVADNATPQGLTFSPPSRPIQLITPAATIAVTGIAQPKVVPDALIAGQRDPAGKAAYYLPALGQRLYAYQLQISESPNGSVPVATGSAAEADLTTALQLKAGSTAVAITDQTGASDASSTLAIPCAVSGSAYPCEQQTTKITVLASVPSNQSVALSSSAAGANQSVDLGTGALTSNVSTVEYGKSALTSKINKTLRTDPYQTSVQVPVSDPKTTAPPDPKTTALPDPKTPDPKTTDPTKADPKAPPTTPTTKSVPAAARWSMKINSAGLTGYDPTLGWAPSGQAWLIISTSAYAQSEDGATFSTDRAASLSVNVANKAYPVKAPSDADLAGDPSNVNWAFAVPSNATEATLTFQPAGTVTANATTVPFTAAPPATLQLVLPG